MDSLVLCEYNVENLFISMEYYAGQDLSHLSEAEWREVALPQLRRRQKPLSKLWGLSEAILDIDADVLMLVEVGGQASLENFNRHFLGDRYEVHFVEGNSRRAIDLAFLVKKGLSWKAEAISNRELPIEVHGMQGKFEARFSRDVAELHLSDATGLRLVLLLTHLKSKLSTERDIGGKDTRTAEAIALAAHYERLHAAHPELPIVLGGDLNADLGSLELELLTHTDLADFQDLLSTPREDRTTLFYFDDGGRTHRHVLDYLLVSPHLRDRIAAKHSGVYRYRAFEGVPAELPTNRTEKARLPSDHYPLVLRLKSPIVEPFSLEK
jgi:endonuclease/exonuclease/phosphatase family metal-dependent hydrolase